MIGILLRVEIILSGKKDKTMDMALANLFKHKTHFVISGELHDIDEPYLYNKGRQYQSNVIENASGEHRGASVFAMRTIYVRIF